eukprot:3984979-Pleurochrysis_carterae.AAC.1
MLASGGHDFILPFEINVECKQSGPFTTRPRARAPPSSAFSLAASDTETIACAALLSGRVGQAIWATLNAN